jgi:hypothetical protein
MLVRMATASCRAIHPSENEFLIAEMETRSLVAVCDRHIASFSGVRSIVPGTLFSIVVLVLYYREKPVPVLPFD